MSVPGIGYDEVGTRTRQAWLRTSLTVIGVTLLAERGLMLAGSSFIILLVTLIPAGVFLVVAVRRLREVTHGESVHAAGTVPLLLVVATMGLAALSVISVVA